MESPRPDVGRVRCGFGRLAAEVQMERECAVMLESHHAAIPIGPAISAAPLLDLVLGAAVTPPHLAGMIPPSPLVLALL